MIDLHAGIPSISIRFKQSPTQYVRVKDDVQQLLSESNAKISKNLESIESLSPLSFPTTIPDDDTPISDQLIAILEWGVVVHGKASKATNKSSGILEENDAVERGIAVSGAAAMSNAYVESGEEPVYSGPFVLLENEIDLYREYFVGLLRMLNTGSPDKLSYKLSDKLIDLFVLFSILENQHQMRIINSPGEITPRRLQTIEGRQGLPMPRINPDEFLLPFLGINFDSKAYSAIQDHLKGPDKGKIKYEYNKTIWGLYFEGDPEKAIDWLNVNIDGFREAYQLDEAEIMNEMDAKTDLWIRVTKDSPWTPVSPEVIFEGYKNPQEILKALFPDQAAQKTRKSLKRGSEQWKNPDLEERPEKESKYSAFRKKKKKKKKAKEKKPIQTKKQKKPSKRETTAQRERRLRKRRESRRKEREKKEKKSKKRNKTNRKKRKDRTIRIGDSVEIHYN